MDHGSFLATLSEADLVLLNGHKVEFQTNELQGDISPVRFTWNKGGVPMSAVIDAHGINHGRSNGGGFVVEDVNGAICTIDTFSKMKPIDLTKRVVSLSFTIGNDDGKTKVTGQDMKAMRMKILEVAKHAVDEGLTSIKSKGVSAWSWRITTEGLRSIVSTLKSDGVSQRRTLKKCKLKLNDDGDFIPVNVDAIENSDTPPALAAHI